MKLSEHWLKQWVNPPLSITELAEQLTLLGLEVESVLPVASPFQNVVVGKVRTREKHPNADRLSLCRVDIGESELLEIVCGAANVRQDLNVAVVKIGGELPGGFKIKETKLRGIISQGMICSAQELHLNIDQEGILELPQNAPIGMNLREYLQLDDHVIDINITPNRGDCLSILGIARELAARNKLQIKFPADKKQIKNAASVKESLTVKLLAPEYCPRYTGRIIRNINAKAITPLFMQEYLRRSGHRPINPIVDVLNYVMLELGQPLHAFDLDQLKGEIQVRFANDAEKMTLIDHQEVQLTNEMLVIADQAEAKAVAGIKGGLVSAVSDNTQAIFLESAFFTPKQIARTARLLGLQTDAAYRFERGVDFNLPKLALERATELLLEICGGSISPVIEVVEEAFLPQPVMIVLRHEQIERVLGISMSHTEIMEILTRLGLTVVDKGKAWEVGIPSYRFDLREEVDLIEELARFHGYQHIPTRLYQGDLKVSLHQEQALPFARLQRLLVDKGYHEVITYSFVNAELEAKLNPAFRPIALTNPMSSDLAVMRTTLLSGLLPALKYNLSRQQARMKLFELGQCFFRNEKNECEQVNKIAGILYGPAHSPQWNHLSREIDFFDVKGDVEQILSITAPDLSNTFNWVIAENRDILHPGQSASIYLNKKWIGYLGALHPSLVEYLDLPGTPYCFELELVLKESLPKYQEISKFPLVQRDIALLIDQSISAKVIQEEIVKFSGALLKKIHIFDIYQGEGIESGKKSIAFGLTFQDPMRTLIDEEVNLIMERVVQGLEQTFSAKLR